MEVVERRRPRAGSETRRGDRAGLASLGGLAGPWERRVSTPSEISPVAIKMSTPGAERSGKTMAERMAAMPEGKNTRMALSDARSEARNASMAATRANMAAPSERQTRVAEAQLAMTRARTVLTEARSAVELETANPRLAAELAAIYVQLAAAEALVEAIDDACRSPPNRGRPGAAP